MTEAERVFCLSMVVGLRAMADEMSAILTRGEAPAAPAAPEAPVVDKPKRGRPKKAPAVAQEAVSEAAKAVEPPVCEKPQEEPVCEAAPATECAEAPAAAECAEAPAAAECAEALAAAECAEALAAAECAEALAAAECAEAPAAAECAEAPAPVDMVALRQMCVALAEAGKTDILRMWLASHGFDRVTQLDEALKAELVSFLKTQGVA